MKALEGTSGPQEDMFGNDRVQVLVTGVAGDQPRFVNFKNHHYR